MNACQRFNYDSLYGEMNTMEPRTMEPRTVATSTYKQLQSWIEPRESERAHFHNCKNTSMRKQSDPVYELLIHHFNNLSLSANSSPSSSNNTSAKNNQGGRLLPTKPLPNDVFQLILARLDSQSLLSARSVHSYWKTQVDTVPWIKEAKLRQHIQRDLPQAITEIFGSIEHILDLPTFDFIKEGFSEKFKMNRKRGRGYQPFCGVDKINFIPADKMKSPIYRFLDPMNRYGFLFLLTDTKNKHFVVSYHEKYSYFEGPNTVDLWQTSIGDAEDFVLPANEISFFYDLLQRGSAIAGTVTKGRFLSEKYQLSQTPESNFNSFNR